MAEVSKLAKGRCIIYNDKPYRIKDIRSVVVSKHSHTKTKVELEDVFTGMPLSLTLPTHENVKEVGILKKTGQFISRIDNGIVHVMDTVSFETFDAGINKELLDELNEGDEIIFVDYEGTRKVIDKKG